VLWTFDPSWERSSIVEVNATLIWGLPIRGRKVGGRAPQGLKWQEEFPCLDWLCRNEFQCVCLLRLIGRLCISLEGATTKIGYIRLVRVLWMVTLRSGLLRLDYVACCQARRTSKTSRALFDLTALSHGIVNLFLRFSRGCVKVCMHLKSPNR